MKSLIIKKENDCKKGKHMKFLVFSDSHNYTNGMDFAIEKHPDIKRIIHCGDVAVDIEYLQDVYGRTHTICAVCGNNDFSRNEPYKRIFPIEGHRIYVTHGHREHVKQTLYTLTAAAREEKCDVCIFGHTHIPLHEECDGITLLNPGSIGYFGMRYAVLIITADTVEITLHAL